MFSYVQFFSNQRKPICELFSGALRALLKSGSHTNGVMSLS